MRDDYAIAADLCEDHGLAAPAALLRQIAEGSGEVFMVRLNVFDIDFDGFSGPLVESTRRTRQIFPSREAAETYAIHLNAELLREHPYWAGQDQFLFTITSDEFCQQVGSILGVDYQFPSDGSPSIIPTGASNEQLLKIAPLFQDKLVEVIRVPLNPQEEP